jgi:hypothetical protein
MRQCVKCEKLGVHTEFYETKTEKQKSQDNTKKTKSKTAERKRSTDQSQTKQGRQNPNSQTESQRRNHLAPTASHERLKPGHRQPSYRLVNVDVKADRARVEVLEVVETGVANGLHLDGDGLTSAAGSLVDVVRVASRHLLGGEHLVGLGLGLVSGALDAGRLQDAELDFAGAGHREGGGLELRLLGEEEVERASLAGVGGGDVEVEDGADRAGGGTVEGGVVALVGLGGVDGDDQVRELGWECWRTCHDQVWWWKRTSKPLER